MGKLRDFPRFSHENFHNPGHQTPFATKEGLRIILKDPSGRHFPWKPPGGSGTPSKSATKKGPPEVEDGHFQRPHFGEDVAGKVHLLSGL